jgi:hypothetical protein
MKILYIALALICVAVVSAAAPYYLKVDDSLTKVSPSISARVDDPVFVTMVLKKVNPIPAEAKLNISVGVVSPIVDVRIDNVTETYRINKFEIPLPGPPQGVKEIEIRVSGYAPRVEKLTEIKVLEVKTYVYYDADNKGYQDHRPIILTISDVEIKQTLASINDAKEKLATVEGIISKLKGRGVNTIDIEVQAQNARDILKTAQTLYEQGQIDLARSTAESASKVLDKLIADAGKIETKKETQTTVKDYAAIAVVVIAVVLIALFIKKRREELG